jgi:hypothetical protein
VPWKSRLVNGSLSKNEVEAAIDGDDAMDFPAWLKNFDLARWWQAAIVVGVVVLLAALAAGQSGIAIIGLAGVFCGFGEWMNHRKEMENRRGGTLTTYERANRPQGLVLVGLGVVLALIGFYRLIVS